ncbi:MAG: hypothetical protein INR71_09800 [Terriglobus roseus]|nr:hypothetical protein [Terriglobus roseus]
MSSCLGWRKSRQDDSAPLLPKYRDDTALQVELHKKLHTYQMIRALGKGFLPSNEQVIVNLRTLLAADVLSPDDNPDLSESGRQLVRYARQWLTQAIELLRHKNYNDEVQDFVWYLSKARISLNVDDVARRASKAKAKADTQAGQLLPHYSIHTYMRPKQASSGPRLTHTCSLSLSPHRRLPAVDE